MPEVRFDYAPIQIHAPFHASPARLKCLFGAVGSGKSYALVSECIARCLETPGLRALIARKYITNLRDTTEAIFGDILPHELWAAGTVRRISGHIDSFTFPNGSVVLFRGMEDWRRHKSLNLGWAGYDEADELEVDTIRGMDTRMRQRDLTREAKALGYRHQIDRRQVCFASNPAGKNYLYDMFVNPDKAWANGEYFRSTSFDNPYLPSDFIDSLLDMPQLWIRRYVLGEFDEFSGVVYPTWSWDTHVLQVRTTPWPPGTQFYHSMDPGLESPCAALWAALDREKHRLVVLHEYQEENRSIREHCQAWRKIEADLKIPRVHWRVADPSIKTRDFGSNMERFDMFKREGFTFDLGEKSHKVRVPALGEMIYGRQFVAQENCPMLHDQLTRYQWQDLSPTQRMRGAEHTEKIRKGNDHLVDAAQYLAGKYRQPYRIPKPQRQLTPQQELAEDVRKAIRIQIQHKRNSRRGRLTSPPGVIR